MKALKHILAAVAALAIFTSCGILGGTGTKTNTGATTTNTSTSTGINTGSALVSILNVLLNSGAIDLGNLTNLINLGQVLLGANSLVDADQTYTQQFAAGLMQGSHNKINKSNVDSVLAGLKALAGTDTSVLSKSTSAAFAGNLVPVSTSNKDVQANMSAINDILKAMK